MGGAVAYSDIPEGFQVKDTPAPSYSDLPEGFSVKPAAPAAPAAKESAVADVAKTVASMPERMVAGGVMALPNIINSAVAGPQLLGRGIAEGVDKLTGTPPQPRGEIWQPFQGSEDVLQSLPKPLRPHTPTTPAGVIADTAGNIATNMLAPKVAPEIGSAVGKGAANIAEGAGTMKAGFNARSPEILDQLDKKYAAMADPLFKEMRTAGITAKPEMTVPLAANVEKDVLEGGKLYPSRHGDTIKVLEAMKEKAKTGMDIEDLDGFRRDFGQIAYKARLTGNKEDAERASEAIDSIDKQFEEMKINKNVPPEMKKTVESLQKAQAIWSARRKFQTLAEAVKKGEGDPNKIKSEFDKILNNPKKLRGFTKEQVQAVKDAAQNTTMEGLLKMAGKFGITIGQGRAAATGNILPALEVGAGMAYHPAGAAGAAGLVGGTAAKYLQRLAAQGKAEKALQSVQQELEPSAAKAIGGL